MLLKNIILLRFPIFEMFATFSDKIDSVEFTIVGVGHCVCIQKPIYLKQKYDSNNYVFLDRETTELIEIEASVDPCIVFNKNNIVYWDDLKTKISYKDQEYQLTPSRP